MSAHRAYLDYNASAPLHPAARAAMVGALDLTANPSSVHAEGRAARRLIEQARGEIAALVGARAEHVVLTSGATEAAATLLTPNWRMGRAPLHLSRLYVAASDHLCVLNGGRFAAGSIHVIGVDHDGLIDLRALADALASHDREQGLPLVAIHAANNETGIIQPMREIGRISKAAGAVTVFDTVQAVGRIPLDISEGYGDFFIVSSHKIGGPKGVGAIVAASDLIMPEPLITGGGQERGHRAGTQDPVAVCGFGAAARQAAADLDRIETVRAGREEIERLIGRLVPDGVIIAQGRDRLANTVAFVIPGMKAETAQIAFDLDGVAVSAGSACSSGKVGPSHVLAAMGMDEEAGALRVSIGHATTMAEIAQFGKALAALVRRRPGHTRAA